MKSQVVILLVGIALLQVGLALAEGEEATTVGAGAEASPVNSTARDSSASVPPSPQEADGAEKEAVTKINCTATDEENSDTPDPNYKCTETYLEQTDTRPYTETYGKCIKIYHKDQIGAYCFLNCARTDEYKACVAKCQRDNYRAITHSCDLGGGAIAGIIIGVLIFLAVAGAGLFFYLKKKRGVANGPQPPAAPPAPANPPPVVSKSNSHV